MGRPSWIMKEHMGSGDRHWHAWLKEPLTCKFATYVLPFERREQVEVGTK